jgi:hypothetical protein
MHKRDAPGVCPDCESAEGHHWWLSISDALPFYSPYPRQIHSHQPVHLPAAAPGRASRLGGRREEEAYSYYSLGIIEPSGKTAPPHRCTWRLIAAI